MWKEISPRHCKDVWMPHVKTYLSQNPVESLVDFEDDYNSELTVRRFIMTSSFVPFKVCFFECDKRFLKSVG